MRRRHAGAAAIAALLAGAVACGAACARASPAPLLSPDGGMTPSGAVAPPAPKGDTVYRCGDTYSPRACPGARLLDVDDFRTAAQRRQAQDVAARDGRLAALLEAQRHARDREEAVSRPLSKPAAPHQRARPADCRSPASVACPARAARARKGAVAASGGSDAITFRAPAAGRSR